MVLIQTNHGLEPVRVKVWHDWIFINLSENRTTI